MFTDFWQAIPDDIWQGRDDAIEGANAQRLFQVIRRLATPFNTDEHEQANIALLGFCCDQGVALNHGRIGAASAPNAIRRALANFAAHANHHQMVDMGNIVYQTSLAASQQALAQFIVHCQPNLNTLVIGGGHEVAFGHGLGLYQAWPSAKIGIINIDAHLDLRNNPVPSSGTPFKQLADYCQQQGRPFHYLCIGASLAANTAALFSTAQQLAVNIIYDTECHLNNSALFQSLQQFINQVDKIYLTIDLDALSPAIMPAVSAPASLGIDLALLLAIITTVQQSNKLMAADLAEFNPLFDPQATYARIAARIIWQLVQQWPLIKE